ncbi:PTS sugar transporter subunit IIB [Eubacteriales bacterium OttesenSCG-928-M02]|nr:PTS sugar transporter subunit IIB [Eubacteriales bacterium OttesenSCG-928-M02]
MAIMGYRVDDRLVHGQVVSAWVKALDLNQLLVVDKRIAGDGFIKKVLAMMAPKGTQVTVWDFCKGAEEISRMEELEEMRAMVILKDPIGALELYTQGVKMARLCIGGMQRGENRELVQKDIYASQMEMDALFALKDKGVQIYEQQLPHMEEGKLLFL